MNVSPEYVNGWKKSVVRMLLLWRIQQKRLRKETAELIHLDDERDIFRRMDEIQRLTNSNNHIFEMALVNYRVAKQMEGMVAAK